jgi:hypothetical protein
MEGARNNLLSGSRAIAPWGKRSLTHKIEVTKRGRLNLCTK